jgi:hypothetical protein
MTTVQLLQIYDIVKSNKLATAQLGEMVKSTSAVMLLPTGAPALVPDP